MVHVPSADLFLSAGSDRTLSLFNINAGSVDRFLDLQHDDSVLSVCVSSDCHLLASGAADQLIRVTDTNEEDIHRNCTLHSICPI